MPTFTAQQIAERLRGDLAGRGDIRLTGVGQIDQALPEQITFIRNERYVSAWANSKASAVLVSITAGPVSPGDGRAVITVPDADAALSTVLEMFAPPPPRPPKGVHRTATVDPTASVALDVSIGPNCYIGARVKIERGTIVHANVTILDETVVGADCEIFPGCSIRDRCRLGSRVILQSGVVIGADGFGYRPAPDRKGVVKIPHIGTVEIGDDVEIGANSCVDRGKFAATTIGDGTKIDNLVQIAHNCRVGRSCLIAGRTGLAGSVTLGDGVILGGGVLVKDHATVGDRAVIAGGSGVMNDVPAGEVWAGYPASEQSIARREYAAMRRLPEILKSLKKQS
jgi:UDP-3-O-[3-hydroxymyristoyl] glucosamine N-acyltransferase